MNNNVNISTVRFRREENSKLEIGICIETTLENGNVSVVIIDKRGEVVNKVYSYGLTMNLFINTNIDNIDPLN